MHPLNTKCVLSARADLALAPRRAVRTIWDPPAAASRCNATQHAPICDHNDTRPCSMRSCETRRSAIPRTAPLFRRPPERSTTSRIATALRWQTALCSEPHQPSAHGRRWSTRSMCECLRRPRQPVDGRARKGKPYDAARGRRHTPHGQAPRRGLELPRAGAPPPPSLPLLEAVLFALVEQVRL